MRLAGNHPTPDTRDTRGWRKHLPAYGTVDPVLQPTDVPPPRRERRRSHALGWLIALALGAGVAMLAVHSLQDPRSVGTQLDDTVAHVRAAGDQAGQTLADSQNAVAEVSQGAVAGVNTALSDAGISVKVKAALAADPALSASRINVQTDNGIVRLEGPAPDATAKDRATVLAGAPRGVRGVDNRLTLPQAGQVVGVADSTQRAAQATPAVPAPDPQAPAVITGDAAVTARIVAALAAEPALAKERIAVTTQQGIVRMEGVVQNAAAKERALALANAQPGVKSVDNRLLTGEAATLLARSPTEQ